MGNSLGRGLERTAPLGPDRESAQLPRRSFRASTLQLPVGRQTAPYSPVPDSDTVLIEPRLRHRTPSAWMRFCKPFGDCEGGSIPLHWMAALLWTWWQHFAALGGRFDYIRQK